MPELPEVEHFRTLLLPLVSSKHPIHLERCSLDKTPPRKFIADEDIAKINTEKYHLTQVLRKGKQIAMVLEKSKKTDEKLFLMVHMGMTGRISNPFTVPELKELSNNDYPPPHTYLKFTCHDQEACFSDPRKFGSVILETSREAGFQGLAPDAWSDVTDATKSGLIAKLTNQSMGIKALLLDQKRVVCGVGNWVADEVLYQTRIHPDQSYLTLEQSTQLLDKLHSILSTAVECLVEKKQEFPKDWLFHYRWNSKKTTKDAEGRVVTFVTSGGRTSAIVPSLQQTRSQKPSKTISKKDTSKKEKPAKTTSAYFDGNAENKVSSKSPSASSRKRKEAPVEESVNVKTEPTTSTKKVETLVPEKEPTATSKTTSNRKRVKTDVPAAVSSKAMRHSPRLAKR